MSPRDSDHGWILEQLIQATFAFISNWDSCFSYLALFFTHMVATRQYSEQVIIFEITVTLLVTTAYDEDLTGI